jgi:uncharacterized protein YggL (DUF469 family)
MKRSKRIRKKLKCGEFENYGFLVTGTRTGEIEPFCTDTLELRTPSGKTLLSGGSLGSHEYPPMKLFCDICNCPTCGPRNKTTEADRQWFASWLEERRELYGIQSLTVSPLMRESKLYGYSIGRSRAQ